LNDFVTKTSYVLEFVLVYSIITIQGRNREKHWKINKISTKKFGQVYLWTSLFVAETLWPWVHWLGYPTWLIVPFPPL